MPQHLPPTHRPTDERTTTAGIGTRPDFASVISCRIRSLPSVSRSTWRRRTSETERLLPLTVGLTEQ